MNIFKMKKLLLYSLVLFLGLSACRKDSDNITNETTHIPEPEITINSSVLGRVIDENDDPVDGATVYLQNAQTTTDINGVFIFKNKSVNAQGAYVKVEKQGYFHGSRTFVPFANTTANVRVKLMSDTPTESVNASTGGEVTYQNGAKLSFPANSVVDINGNGYTGNINIATKFLDPLSEELNDIMPGDLRAINSQNEQTLLKTFGMLAVELTDDAGQKLQVADGQKVVLTFPLDPSLVASAPATIPLWYFDEDNGYWVEEGSATLQGNTYVGEVAHFSFWNCDVPNNFVNINGTIVNKFGVGINGLIVTITSAENGSGYGITDDQGNFGGFIPPNEVLTLDIQFVGCYNTIYTEEIGPFSEDTDMEDIYIDEDQIQTFSIVGNVVDCEGDPVQNGYIFLSTGGGAVIDNGSVSGEFLICSDILGETVATAVDLDNLEQNSNTFSIENNTVDIGSMAACGEDIDEVFIPETPSIYILYNGIVYTMQDPGSIQSNTNSSQGYTAYANASLNTLTDKLQAIQFATQNIITSEGVYDIGNGIPTEIVISMDNTLEPLPFENATLTIVSYADAEGEFMHGILRGDDGNGNPVVGAFNMPY